MRRALLSVAALLAFSLAYADGSLAGKYRLHDSGSQGSDRRLTLRVNGRFLLEDGHKVTHGDYRVEDGRLVLRTEDGDRLRAEVRNGAITLDGQSFERVTPVADDSRRFPTDAASGRLRRVEDRRDDRDDVRPEPQSGRFGAPLSTSPVLDPSPLIAPPVFVPSPAVANVLVSPALPALLLEDCCGAWTVHRNGFEEKGQRMELKKDGTFRFGMRDATSEGTWTIEGREIVLRYLRVDGEPLEEGASGIKRIPVARDATAFQIDTFRYERATDK